MTLSNKSWKVIRDPINPNDDLDVIKTSDVKDFIRKLKEEFVKDIKNRKLRSEKTVLGQFNYILDKLAGDKLI